MPNVDNIFELHQFFDALRRSRESALLLDYDGTLSPFQLDRAEAVPYLVHFPVLFRLFLRPALFLLRILVGS